MRQSVYRRIAKAAGVTLIAAGLTLLAGVGAFYGLGLYSSTQLEKLTAEVEGPLALPDDTIIHGALLPDGSFAGVKRVTDPNEIAGFKPVPQPPRADSADAQAPPSVSTSVNGAPEAASSAASAQPAAYTSFPVAQYASLYPGALMHPKYWGQPMWAGTDPYPTQRPARPDGFIPVSATDESLAVNRPNASRIVIPGIGVDSVVSDLAIIDLGNSKTYETPNNVVGHIPGSANPGQTGNGWFFGHLESPLKGEGNVFNRLPEIPAKITNGEAIYVSLISDDGEYLYQVISSKVMHESELRLYQTSDATITLVTCSNRPHYDYRQVVTAKLVGIRPL